MQIDSRTLAVCLWPPFTLPGVPEPPSVDAIGSGSVTILLDDAPGQQLAGTATTIASGTAPVAPAAADREAAPAVAPAAPGSKKAPTRAAHGSQSGTGAAAPPAATDDGSSTGPVPKAAVAGAGGTRVVAPAPNRFNEPQPPPPPPAAAHRADQSAATMGHARSRQTVMLSPRGCFFPQLKLYQHCPPRQLSSLDLSTTLDVLRLPQQLGLHCYPAAGEVGLEVSVAVTVPTEAACIASESQAAFLRTNGLKAAVVEGTHAAMAVAGALDSSRGALQQQGQQQQGQQQQQQQGHGAILWLHTIWNQKHCRLQWRGEKFYLRCLKACLLPFADWRLVHCWQVMVCWVGCGYVCHSA